MKYVILGTLRVSLMTYEIPTTILVLMMNIHFPSTPTGKLDNP